MFSGQVNGTSLVQENNNREASRDDEESHAYLHGGISRIERNGNLHLGARGLESYERC